MTDVEEASPADEVGLRRGDLILEVNQQKVANLQDFRAALGRTTDAKSVLFLIRRRDNTLYVALQLVPILTSLGKRIAPAVPDPPARLREGGLSSAAIAPVECIYFIDEIFLPNADLMGALAVSKVKFGIPTRIDLWSHATLDLLDRDGCFSSEVGVEIISPEGRELLDKQCKLSTDELSERLILQSNPSPSYKPTCSTQKWTILELETYIADLQP